MKLWTGGRWSMIALVVVVGAAVAGIAYASIPDGSGVIHGCYSNKNGALRLIDTGAGGQCSDKETAVSWDQTVPSPENWHG
jgi:hypothetical protein